MVFLASTVVSTYEPALAWGAPEKESQTSQGPTIGHPVVVRTQYLGAWRARACYRYACGSFRRSPILPAVKGA